jgi:hypothetical protein
MLVFEKIKQDWYTPRQLTKRKRDKTYINQIRYDKQDITKNTNANLRIIKGYFKNIHSNKFENSEETD